MGQEIKRDGIGAVDYDIATGRPVGGEFSRALDVREPYSIKIGLVSADIESNMDWARFNSITSVQSSSLSRHRDFTVFAALLGDPDIATVPQSSHVTQRRQTQEFRLTSLTKGPIEWLAGFYYEHETGSNDQDIGTTLVDGSAGPSLATVRGPASYIETALYGDLTWNATDKLALTGGVRAARNRQTYSQNTDGPLLGGATNRVGYSAESSQTYLVTARYKLTPASSAYLRAASGYRPGGPNDVIKDQTTGLPLAPPTFQHDTLWSYEAGYKADLLGKTLSLEAALYDIRWKQIQDFENVNGVSVIVNNGKARIKGVELSARYLPTPEWDLRASLAFNDAHALETIADQVTAGDRLPNSARLSAALAVNRNFQFAGLASYAGATVRYVGDRNAGFDASTTLPNYRLPAYALTDLQAGAQFGQFALQLYLRNAFDRSAQLNASTSAVPLGGPVLVTPARPRTFGVNWVASF